jgi:hypothetical protein
MIKWFKEKFIQFQKDNDDFFRGQAIIRYGMCLKEKKKVDKEDKERHNGET